MIYLLLGVFDASAVIILALKLYRLPFREYIKDIALMSLGVSLFSYLMRIVIGIPTLDLPIQVIFFILFLDIV